MEMDETQSNSSDMIGVEEEDAVNSVHNINFQF